MRQRAGLFAHQQTAARLPHVRACRGPRAGEGKMTSDNERGSRVICPTCGCDEFEEEISQDNNIVRIFRLEGGGIHTEMLREADVSFNYLCSRCGERWMG